MMQRAGSIVLFHSIVLSCLALGQNPTSSKKIVVQVINKHYTMGRGVPSVYLRVFSNGTVECHTMKYTGVEAELVKKKTLTAEEFDGLRVLLESPGLTQVEKRYALMYRGVDSWMEWDIKVPHGPHMQEILMVEWNSV